MLQFLLHHLTDLTLAVFSGPIIVPSGPSTPSNAYTAEDGATPYVAEDGVTYYVQES